jgi:hypothetical protein
MPSRTTSRGFRPRRRWRSLRQARGATESGTARVTDAELWLQDLLCGDEESLAGPRIQVRRRDLRAAPDHAGARVGAIMSSMRTSYMLGGGGRLCAQSMLEDTAGVDGLLAEQSGRGRFPRVRTVSRTYQPGDEAQINRLYRSLTGRDRTLEEFAWEWLDTWAGQGSMNLVRPRPRGRSYQQLANAASPRAAQRLGRPLMGKTEELGATLTHRVRAQYPLHDGSALEREKERGCSSPPRARCPARRRRSAATRLRRVRRLGQLTRSG